MIDKYLDELYDHYNNNCAHFAAKVWKDLTGNDITFLYHPTLFVKDQLRRIPKPQDPCIVMFFYKADSPHVGIYYKGKVAHLNSQGVMYQTLEDVQFMSNKIRFYVQ